MEAVIDGADDNAIARKMTEYYGVDTAARVSAYNSWMRANFVDETTAIIGTAMLFAGLGLDQKVGFGLWMTSKGELSFI